MRLVVAAVAGVATGLVTGAWACAPDSDAAAPAIVVRDSAGIHTVAVHVPVGEAPVWAVVDSRPSLRLGVVEGPEHLVFGQVSAVLPLADGGVAVADGQAREVRLFGPDGAWLRTLGGEGEGPGELSGIPELLGARGDTLFVWDGRQQRVSRFDLRSGALLGELSLRGEAGDRIRALAMGPAGRLLAVSTWTAGGSAGGMPESHPMKLVRDTLLLRVLTSSGERMDTVAVLPGPESVQAVTSTPMGTGYSVSVRQATRPFGRDGHWAVGAAGVWAGASDAFEVRRWDPEGRLAVWIRWPAAARPSDMDELFPELEPETRGAMLAALEGFPPPAQRPAFGALLVDDEGRLWVGPWVASTRAVPDPWHVFTAEGEPLGSVTVPAGLRVEAVAEATVWGVREDDLGVSRVEAYRLRAD